MGVFYCTRDDIKRELDIAETARSGSQIDRSIESSSRAIEGPRLLNRRFYPELTTHYFDWPALDQGTAFTLWLDRFQLISASTVTSGGTTVSANDYFLRPDDGPPFSRVEIDLSSSATFQAGDTSQRSIAITGLYGYTDDSASVGTASAVASTSTTTVDVSNSSTVGVGSVIKIDDERMIVSNKAMMDTTDNLGAGIAAQKSVVTVPVGTGSNFAVDEIILIDSERMLIVDIAGNNLTVQRAYDGTVLAAHSINADIYAPRRLTVSRGALGTTAATHAGAAAVTRWVPPPLVTELCIAETMFRLGLKRSGYGSGGGQDTFQAGGARPAKRASTDPLADLRALARAAHGRAQMPMAV